MSSQLKSPLITLKFSRPNKSNQRSSCRAYMLLPTCDTYRGLSKKSRGLHLPTARGKATHGPRAAGTLVSRYTRKVGEGGELY